MRTLNAAGREAQLAARLTPSALLPPLPAPFDGQERSASLLARRVVQTVHPDEVTGDLRIILDAGTPIDIFNCSSGYEGWDACYSVDDERWGVIAMGRCGIAVVPAEERRSLQTRS